MWDQHLVRRDSSVATGTSAVALIPELVTEVRWGGHKGFSDKTVREAAEAVAFEVLDPALRSRGRQSTEAAALVGDGAFRTAMKDLFSGEPAGTMVRASLEDALRRIHELERRIAALERRPADDA